MTITLADKTGSSPVDTQPCTSLIPEEFTDMQLSRLEDTFKLSSGNHEGEERDEQ